MSERNMSRLFPYLWGVLDRHSATRSATQEERSERLTAEVKKIMEYQNHDVFLYSWSCLNETERADLTAAILKYGGKRALSDMFMALQEDHGKRHRAMIRDLREMKDRAEAAEEDLHLATERNDAWLSFVMDVPEWNKMIRFLEAIADAQTRTSTAGVSAEDWAGAAKETSKTLELAVLDRDKWRAECKKWEVSVGMIREELDDVRRLRDTAVQSIEQWRADYVELEAKLAGAESTAEDLAAANVHHGRVVERCMNLLSRVIQLDMDEGPNDLERDLQDILAVAKSIREAASGLDGKILVRVTDHKLGSGIVYAIRMPDNFKGDKRARESHAMKIAKARYEGVFGAKPSDDHSQVIDVILHI